MININDLYLKSKQIRRWVFDVCVNAKTGHLTSSLSCVDILVALYYSGILKYDSSNPDWDKRDKFILSKGQASIALYSVLADCGFFDKLQLLHVAQLGGIMGTHPQRGVPGIEITSGSLGHGLNVAVGMALANKKDKLCNTIFTLIGDGECYEGSIWEAAMFASHNNLNNLVVIMDRNKLCATDFTEECLAIEPLIDKWKSFGWETCRIDGHNMSELIRELQSSHARSSSKPKIIIADTIKGYGIPSIYYQPLWHSRTPTNNDEIVKFREEIAYE